MENTKLLYYIKHKTIYRDFIQAYFLSLIIHIIIIIILILTPAQKINWKNTFNLTPKSDFLKISKLINTKQALKKQDKNLFKSKKTEKPIEPVSKIAPSVRSPIENIKELAPDIKEKEKENIEPLKPQLINDLKEISPSIEELLPSKIVLNDSQSSLKSSFKINFSEAEVVKGKKTWIGYSVGNGSLSSSLSSLRSPLKNSSLNSRTKGIGSGKNNSEYFNSAINIMDSSNQSKLQEKIYESSELDSIPEFIEYIPPVYPELAHRMGIEGKVSLKILIDPEGYVKRVEPIEQASNAVFEESAIAAVKQWKFSPPTVNGQPVSIWFLQTLTFTFE
ncbi:MAG: energy transducer TonB [Candidatus Firestonebacteria bacterium]|nr:energy transducer TonB [Candidatus Firestonebacteria bacterium]